MMKHKKRLSRQGFTHLKIIFKKKGGNSEQHRPVNEDQKSSEEKMINNISDRMFSRDRKPAAEHKKSRRQQSPGVAPDGH